ncbi:MAG: hypothetical protein JRN26_01275 [Nitrososphaerota archaeon]|nr:hypothetical protein [Nitrososphaerota archaeon]MDG6932704.1 hypothetical protein [Nitrososphaerota archaeon]MDG6935510.1 hypothetical protein [Nitrososphaerota archaeon]MDG6943405.1 hypothetical protein [Nitrososphaerota archaeon]
MQEAQETTGIEELLSLAKELIAKHGNNAGAITALKKLVSEQCDSKVMYELEHGDYESGQKFDAIYGEKSTYATTVIIDNLKRRLLEHGYTATIAAEETSEVGRYDVVIRSNGNGSCSIYSSGAEKVRLEIKAAEGMPLEQISRYLFDRSSLVVVRVLLGDVFVLRYADVRQYVKFLVELETSKVRRLLEGKPVLVPGYQCYDCPNTSCTYNRVRVRSVPFIKPKDLGWDLSVFFNNLPGVSERTAELVIKELERQDGA